MIQLLKLPPPHISRNLTLYNSFDLKDKVILITGSAGFLGRHYVDYFINQGSVVVGWDIKIDNIEGPNLQRKNVDIINYVEVQKSVASLIKTHGHIDALICNAGIDYPPSSFSIASIDEGIEVNIKGTMNCIRVIGKEMVFKGKGSIILIGSVYGMLGPDQSIYDRTFTKPAIYSITKSSLYGMAKYYAALWGHSGVRINVLTLGGVKNEQDAGFIERYSAKVPMERMAQPKDYFGALHFLVSDASTYMTGANLVIDGGYSAW